MKNFLGSVVLICAVTGARAEKLPLSEAPKEMLSEQKQDYPEMVRLSILPSNLWPRAPRPGGRLTLTYTFVDRSDARPCPDRDLSVDPSLFPECGRFQEAVVAALRRWGDASGRVDFQPAADPSSANVYIGWSGSIPQDPLGNVMDGTLDPAAEGPQSDPEDTRRAFGFGWAESPRMARDFVSMYFSRNRCWTLGDPSVCRSESYGRASKGDASPRSIARVAMHEAGHVMGFAHAHPSRLPTVMPAGGSGFDDLQDVDRRAVRALYDQVLAAAPPP